MRGGIGYEHVQECEQCHMDGPTGQDILKENYGKLSDKVLVKRSVHLHKEMNAGY